MAARSYTPVYVTRAWLEACRKHAAETFASPPAAPHIVRPDASDLEVVATLFLPLPLLEPQNRKRNVPTWILGLKGRDLQTALGVQTRFRDHRHIRPLAGRPMVLCTRFSSVEPDKYCDGFKWAIDALCVPAGRRTWGLGYLRDDRPKDAEIHQWWEPAPQRGGFGIIRVFEDANRGDGRA